MHFPRVFHWASAGFAVLLLSIQVQAQAYRLSGNQLAIDRRSHWVNWEIAGGLVEISPDGRVIPRFIQKNTNAALDAEQFENSTGPGGLEVGSNPSEARNLIDGDLDTSWGPDPDSPLENWRFTLHLGRIVVASKIVLRFAAEDVGDPFLQFKVLVWRQGPKGAWDRPYTLVGTNIPNFWEIGRTDKSNKQQRVFEFVVEPTQSTDELFTGDPIEAVRVIVTDSDFSRAEEISKEAYEALLPEKRGVVEYYRKDASGRETLVSEQDYQVIDAANQGPIRYFRKEIPRLAEIEVWTPGENINMGATERGGILHLVTDAGPKDLGRSITDGDYSTGHDGSIFEDQTFTFFEDLGALFWVDTMQFILDGATSIDEFFLDVSDGTRAPDGTIKWTRVAANLVRSKFREFRIEPVRLRYIRTPFQNPTRRLSYIGITEVMLYGEGYVPEVVLSSGLIELGARKNLIAINWEADTPPGTTVQMQTRTGNQLDEIKIYHDTSGKVVSEVAFNKLPSFKQGEITSLFVPGGDWSTWSPPHRHSGELILSPSPREFMEIRALLLSERADAAPTLRSVTVDLSNPLADQLLGEVWPNRTETTGKAEEFAFFLRPSFSGSRQGFDEIAIAASAGVALEELLEVRLGSDADFLNNEATLLTPAELAEYRTRPDTLWFRLSDPVRRGVDMVEIRFRSTIFANSASFDAAVQSSGTAGFWQKVDGGEATDLVDSQTTTVLALGDNKLIKDVRLDSRVVTPNGDGVNDALKFSFSIARLIQSDGVSVSIYDLSGALVKKLSADKADPRGQYDVLWFGENASGQLVPVGIYLARIEVDTDVETGVETSAQRLVYVAY